MAENLEQNFPQLPGPMVDPETGQVTQEWRFFFMSLWNRTGASTGGLDPSLFGVQLANTVLAGPAAGIPLAALFRALVAADIPNISANKITSDTLAPGRLPQATELAIGAAELATGPEALSGTDANKIVTSAGLASERDVAGTDGYMKFPGGLLLQWGTVTPAAGVGTVTFPVTFSSVIFNIQASIYNGPTVATNAVFSAVPRNITLSGCDTIHKFETGAARGNASEPAYWLAVGI